MTEPAFSRTADVARRFVHAAEIQSREKTVNEYLEEFFRAFAAEAGGQPQQPTTESNVDS